MVPTNPDFAELINDLIRAGLRYKDIAKEIDCHISSVGNIRNKRWQQVVYTTGARLQNLHEKVVKNGQATKRV